jgi:NifU-like protein involved in Fe-S cluster formation
MSADPYNSAVRRLFSETPHAGDVSGGEIAYFEDQGMRIRLSARVVNGALAELRFRAWACPHVIAAAESFCQQFEGRPIAELEQFETGQIMKQLAVPVEKTGRILVLESLRAAISDRIAT